MEGIIFEFKNLPSPFEALQHAVDVFEIVLLLVPYAFDPFLIAVFTAVEHVHEIL